jgi:type VI secretion system protein ImpF
MKERNTSHFQVSLMNVFRQAARERDARARDETEVDSDGRVLSARTIERREGSDQATLRKNLAADLGNLMGTIHLEATVPLDGLDHVRASVLNYGIQDMSRFSVSDAKNPKLLSRLREQLLAHEPRLIAETLKITLRREEADSRQRIAFDVVAEMTARPVDVPLEFVAEIDTGEGKIAISDLAVRG